MSNPIPLTVADFETGLDVEVVAGDLIASLISIEDANGIDLANGFYGFTVDGDVETSKEYIVATLTGTALSSVVSVSVQGTATTGFSKFHRRGASVAVTDWASLSRIVTGIGTTTGLDPSVHIGYSSAPVGLTGNEFATIAYVLSVVSGGTVNLGQQVLVTQTYGENLTANDHVYFKEADAKWYKVDADITTTFQQLKRGIALSTGNINTTGTIAISGSVTGFSGLSAGSKYYASNTAGAIQNSAGTNPVFVGWALSTTAIVFDVYGRDIPYGSQKDALAGSFGSPSSANKYLTQVGQSDGSVDQQQATQNGSYPVGQANATTKPNVLAQSFIPADTLIRGVNLYKSASTGTFTGTVKVSIQADSAGSPSGADLASKTITNALYNSYATGDFLALLSSELTITPGSLYWIVITPSTSDNSNCINIGTNTSGGYASGSVKQFNTTDGWVTVATIDLYFKVNQGFSAKVIEATSTGFIPTSASKIIMKRGTVALSAVTTVGVTHGLGKVPAIIRATYAEGDSSHMQMSYGTYDVGNAAYLYTEVHYNEASNGGGSIGTDSIVASGATSGVLTTVIAVDENVVIFSITAGPPTIGWEAIG